MVAYGGAGGVPIAVPFSCLKVRSPKVKMFRVMIRRRPACPNRTMWVVPVAFSLILGKIFADQIKCRVCRDVGVHGHGIGGKQACVWR